MSGCGVAFFCLCYPVGEGLKRAGGGEGGREKVSKRRRERERGGRQTQRQVKWQTDPALLTVVDPPQTHALVTHLVLHRPVWAMDRLWTGRQAGRREGLSTV
jgi:hypothetical protein